MIKHNIDEQLTGVSLQICICSYEDFDKYMSSICTEWVGINKPANALHTYFFDKKNRKRRFIWMPKFELHIMAHELVHFVHRACDDKNIDYSAGNDEISAMMYEYFFTRICTRARKNHKKLNNII